MNRFALTAALIVAATVMTAAQKPEATSLSGKALMIPSPIPNQQKLEADLAQAEKTLAANPKDAEAIIWTGRRLEMSDLRRNSRTILTLEKLEYNVPLKDEDFTLQALRNPV